MVRRSALLLVALRRSRRRAVRLRRVSGAVRRPGRRRSAQLRRLHAVRRAEGRRQHPRQGSRDGDRLDRAAADRLRSVRRAGAHAVRLRRRALPRRQRARPPERRARADVALRHPRHGESRDAGHDRAEGHLRLRRSLAGRFPALPDPAHLDRRHRALHRARVRPRHAHAAARAHRRQDAEELGDAGVGDQPSHHRRRPLGLHAVCESGRLPVHPRARHGPRRRALHRAAVDGGPGSRLHLLARAEGATSWP